MEKKNSMVCLDSFLVIFGCCLYASMGCYLLMEEPNSGGITAIASAFPHNAIYGCITLTILIEFVEAFRRIILEYERFQLDERDDETDPEIQRSSIRILSPMVFHLMAFSCSLFMAPPEFKCHNCEFHYDTLSFTASLFFAGRLAWDLVEFVKEVVTFTSGELDSDDLLAPLLPDAKLPSKKPNGLLPQLFLILIMIVMWWGFSKYITWPVYKKDEILGGYFFTLVCILILKLIFWVDESGMLVPDTVKQRCVESTCSSQFNTIV